MKSLMFAVIGIAGLASTVPAAAQVIDATPKSGAYGVLDYTRGETTGHSDNSSDQVGVKGGWRFNRFLGAEVEGNFGFNGDSGSYLPTGSDTALGYDSHMRYQVAGYGVGYLPLSHNLDLFARVGYGTQRIKLDIPAATDIGFHEESWNFGGGAQYLFNGKDGIRAEYTRYSMDSNSAPIDTPLAGRDIDNWSVGYVHKF